MFVLEFEKPLFEFAYERPHCDLLFALPPTFSSSTMYHLSFAPPHGGRSSVLHGLYCSLCITVNACVLSMKESFNRITLRSLVYGFFQKVNNKFAVVYCFCVFSCAGSLADVPWALRAQSHRHELRAAHEFGRSVEGQTSADVRPRVRETVVRVRVRKTAPRPVVRATPNVQQLTT